MADITASALGELISATDSRGIAGSLRELVENRTLESGVRLPTVRAVAVELGVSVGTVAKAWSQLRADGVIETRQRGGTRVLGAARPPAQDEAPVAWSDVDFLFCSPDPALLPPLDHAVATALKTPHFNEWGREYIVQALHRIVSRGWPFEATGWMTAGGGTEGLWLATRAAVGSQRVVACEEPLAPGFLAGLQEEGLTVVGVPVDDEGPTVEGVRTAIDAGAAALVLSPGGPFSDRHVLSSARAEELADLLEGTDVAVVEDDVLGPLSTVPVRTLGHRLPQQTIRVQEYCRAFGIDLRTSVIGGAKHLVDAAIHQRSGGVASNSRLLQDALAALLGDARTGAAVHEARQRYARRRERALAAFTAVGLTVHSGPGSWALWVEVADERSAALALSSHGIVVDVASASHVSPDPKRQRLRLSLAQLPESSLDELAQRVADAARGRLGPVIP
ncbi:MAG: aminotransferase class I/II-fold pyridoxal phosphate-dependent enzyme [Micrococcaceae bacterium]